MVIWQLGYLLKFFECKLRKNYAQLTMAKGLSYKKRKITRMPIAQVIFCLYVEPLLLLLCKVQRTNAKIKSTLSVQVFETSKWYKIKLLAS